MSYKAHWQSQRFTAIILAFVYPGLLGLFYSLKHASYGTILQKVSEPLIATFLAMTLLVSLYHAVLGLQVILDDYIKQLFIRELAIKLLKFGALVAFIFSFISLIKVMILGIQL